MARPKERCPSLWLGANDDCAAAHKSLWLRWPQFVRSAALDHHRAFIEVRLERNQIVRAAGCRGDVFKRAFAFTVAPGRETGGNFFAGSGGIINGGCAADARHYVLIHGFDWYVGAGAFVGNLHRDVPCAGRHASLICGWRQTVRGHQHPR